ncbi:fatty acid desaturase [Frigidibacter sp. SD6-1]|uniref:fatty acid desaturase n=1 Tax=Frigidibacter sp. SD6-1 TaxID=3032581 RepID=UPI0024DFFFA4|nr:fatty acid desaturase [Frigidibacter sp. SD6-1]
MTERAGLKAPAVEWPTLALIAACHALWYLGVSWAASTFLPFGMALTILAITLHSSLQHEVLHGHPTHVRALNEALVALPLGLLFPYGRFRDLHLAHHRDEYLTDPYDDPESNFQDPQVWARLPGPFKALLRFNNTLLGRMLVGPAIACATFVPADLRAILRGDRAIARDWALHLAGLGLLTLILRGAEMPWWAYLMSAYAGLAILKIRTFLEHRAHEIARCRSVIVEGGRVLPFLFLNNNLHIVHHTKPGLAWYLLPAHYRAHRAEYLRRNDSYLYRNYGEIFRAHFLRAKDPVPHPLRPGEG